MFVSVDVVFWRWWVESTLSRQTQTASSRKYTYHMTQKSIICWLPESDSKSRITMFTLESVSARQLAAVWWLFFSSFTAATHTKWTTAENNNVSGFWIRLTSCFFSWFHFTVSEEEHRLRFLSDSFRYRVNRSWSTTEKSADVPEVTWELQTNWHCVKYERVLSPEPRPVPTSRPHPVCVRVLVGVCLGTLPCKLYF